jgi:hypothetical protein
MKVLLKYRQVPIQLNSSIQVKIVNWNKTIAQRIKNKKGERKIGRK